MYQRFITRLVFITCLALVMSTNFTFAQEGAEESGPSLYERLGGLPAITVFVDDLVDQLNADSVIMSNPAIAEARAKVPGAYLKYRVSSLICQATGGGCTYNGRTMKAAHAHLNISDVEWKRMTEIFTGLVAKYKIGEKEAAELTEIVNSVKDDIVTVK